MSQNQITFPDKTTGDTFSGVEATEIKTIVNENAVDAEARMTVNSQDIITKLPKILVINNTPTGQYTLLDSDNGKLVKIDTDLIIPTGLLVGLQCSIFLDNGTAQTLDTSGLTVKGNDQAANISGNGILAIAVIATDTVLIAGEMEA